MRICMVGTGYVGLVSGAGFAEIGNDVVCADVDPTKIAKLRKGEIPIFEPGLEELVKRNAAAKHPVHVVSNPEFLKEGDAVVDFLRPDRVVVGCDADDEFAHDVMARLYHPLSMDRDRIVWMSPPSAELTKYVSNTMLAMRI